MKNEFKLIDEFIGDTNKSKLTDTQAYLTVKNTLLFCVKFSMDNEIYLLGEEDDVRKAVENPEKLSRYRKSLLMYSEEKTIGNLLFESNYFVENGLQTFIPTFDALILSMDKGLSKLVSDLYALRQSWSEGSIFQKIFINYFCFKFYRTKHQAAEKTPLTAHKPSVRREMYADLKKEIDREFNIISRNPTSLSDLKKLRLKTVPNFENDVIFCYNFEEFYVQYISYLASRDMYFRTCKKCSKAFYSDTHQRQYHEKCAELQLKENKMQSQRNFQKDTLLGLCQKERYHYNNFKRSKVYLNATADLKEEYDALFDRFKAQLAEYKIKLKTDKDGVAAFACAKWFEKIRGEREDLENRFHGNLKE